MTASATTKDWKPTACILCYANCGIEVQVEGRDITRVRGDKNHPRSKGYVCQKAQRLSYYGNHADRLTSPLRRRQDGTFEKIAWETAYKEIAQKFAAIRDQYGGQALAHYGGGGQGNHLGGGYGIGFMRALGARSFYSSIAQEKTGGMWLSGKMFGAENCGVKALTQEADLVVMIGANPWNANCEPGARLHMKHLAKDPHRKLIVIDPVRTKIAEMADLHLAVKPGTDAYLMGAILSLLVARGGADLDFLKERTHGHEEVIASLKKIPTEDWIAISGISRNQVEQAVEMILAAKSMAVHEELGIEMGINSTLSLYLERLLYLVTGHFGRDGTKSFITWLQPLVGNSKGAVSAVTGQAEIAGLYPPNRFPKEILSDKPDRLRAALIDSSNPANSAANTAEVEKALAALDLLVVVDVALSETAVLADYVLPASSQYEKWEFTLFTFDFPTNYIHLREPIFDPLPGTKSEPEIYRDLAREMGFLPAPEVLEDLADKAKNNRMAFAQDIMKLLSSDPVHGAIAPIILYETLGRALPDGAAGGAVLWPACHRVGTTQEKEVQAALGTDAKEPFLGELLFQKIVESRSGTAFNHFEVENIWRLMRNKDQKIRLAVPEMLDWLESLKGDEVQTPEDYPFMLMAGQRRDYNTNQIMRHPGWRKKDPDGALRIHPEDLAAIDSVEGAWITVTTANGQLTARAECDDSLRRGLVTLPHGYGMAYPTKDGKRVVNGPRVNMLTSNSFDDPIAATPYHKNVPAALRRATNEEADRCEAEALLVKGIMEAS